MIRNTKSRIIVVIFPILLLTPDIVARDPNGPTFSLVNGLKITGSFKPEGPPLEQPIRANAGGSCIIDLKQAYVITGSLVGSLEIDYRILVYGPCEVPPILGKYNEEWIAYGTFSGTVNGSSTSCSLTYKAIVKAGGFVEGDIKFSDGLAGKMTVSGNFADGMLSYVGWIE